MKRRGKMTKEVATYRYQNETALQIFERFKSQKQAENLSENSLIDYSQHFELYIRTLEGDRDLPAHDTCTLDNYNTFIMNLRKSDIKDVTIASYCRSIRAIFYWMMDNECISNFTIKIPKFQHTVPDTYTDEELAILLEKPKKQCSYVEYETWVFINLAIATGLRLSSMLSLKVSDIIFSENIISVKQTKNNKGLKLVINDEMLEILDKYIQLFGFTDDSYLFSSAEGTPLHKRTMEDFIYRYEKKRNIKKTKAIHAFRHTFARNFYLQTHDMYRVKELLGHTMISTTEHYLGSLGLDTSTKIEYNPQSQFSQSSNNTKSRRGRRVL